MIRWLENLFLRWITFYEYSHLCPFIWWIFHRSLPYLALWLLPQHECQFHFRLCTWKMIAGSYGRSTSLLRNLYVFHSSCTNLCSPTVRKMGPFQAVHPTTFLLFIKALLTGVGVDSSLLFDGISTSRGCIIMQFPRPVAWSRGPWCSSLCPAPAKSGYELYLYAYAHSLQSSTLWPMTITSGSRPWLSI